MKPLRSYLPILERGAEYTGKTFASDLVAAVIIAIMLRACIFPTRASSRTW